MMGAILEAASTNKVPTIGPVQEKDTIASANAINKIPIIPPLSAYITLFAQELGNIISNAPKNEAAKQLIKQRIILNQTLVDKAFNASAPKIQVTKTLEEHK
jgi:hypothetical protein